MNEPLFESVGGNRFRLKEDRWSRHHPDTDRPFDNPELGVWNNPSKVSELKKSLNNALEAGNFDIAHDLVSQLANLHN